ncbi:bifunctional anthranilate synthase/indole-3-glycerol-phosphate synthase [Spizellomyces punctatus DAOM BR117]|uniref:Multifunctional tryptophan biosynthesis protein n=1 Tax=Spizellomyces punctatus (strain DAOM BR117) TaxID=645134 RepID=A0A0L0HUW5_SPIPD|nr:bifunctional anthranilate synthase/indole-3-glycerol-phosphate synthase [Spizellomyces punctatus DAOM BR117]KND04654.1 hypothetical protein SPPG_00371 [Spizellomyces punctatus DAOM BR117]|eukprot:XP_016612693.1 hypothetical protein SPPG_00371 [Spizellomyces punctatus DAOM BR117]
MTTLLIDNYDSFTWNVYQYLSELGADVQVYRNDQITLEQCIAINPRNVVISPGPGRPADAGVSNDVIRHFAGKVPILGVCLGEQCMYETYGGTVTYAGEIVHGKTSPVRHDGRGLYETVPQGIEATRYHSLAGDPKTLPECLEITSWTDSGIVMGIRHKTFVMEGVQYHPESIASECGKVMFANFLKWEGGTWDRLRLREDLVKKPDGHGGPAVNGASDGKRAGTGDGIPLAKVSKINSTSTAGGGVHRAGGSSPAISGKGMQSTTAASKSPSILHTIYEQRLRDVREARSRPGQSDYYLQRSIALGLSPSKIDFPARVLAAANPVAVMAEIKRASPSKGNIDITAHAPSQALEYARGGAAVISVLTEPKWFKGSLEDMRLVRAALEGVPDRPAVLRKDFIVERYQILEAHLYGADTLLLIVAILDDDKLRDLLEYSRQLGMEPMVEVANSAEMERAVAIGAKVIGVNNRDLHTFNVDMNRTSDLATMVPQGTILVALSGITGRADVETYMKGGAKAVLVGEALMRAPSKRDFIQQLLGKDVEEQPAVSNRTMVKICGVTNVEDALVAAKAGADFIGLIFAESARKVTIDRAKEIVQAVRRELKISDEPAPALPIPSPDASPSTWLNLALSTIRSPRAGPLFVGVFANHSVSFIQQAVRDTKINLVQFHGSEPCHLAALLPTPVIKAFHVLPNETPSQVIDRIVARETVGTISGVLLDTGVKSGQQGGTGQVFDWDVAVHVQREGRVPVLLAGGLKPENVAEAVRKVRPWCVDVSSGVELDTKKGFKDHGKVVDFIKAVRTVDT